MFGKKKIMKTVYDKHEIFGRFYRYLSGIGGLLAMR